MIEITAAHLDEFCRAGPVRMQIGSMEATRAEAAGLFWKRLAISAAATAAIGFGIGFSVDPILGAIGGTIVLVAGLIWAYVPLHHASESVKLPVLEALADKAGMKYQPDNFEPPVFAEARRILFGDYLSSAAFTDLFHGTDDSGSNYAFYEGSLSRRSGKNTEQVFSGQIYAFQRSGHATGLTVILPDKGLFNFFKPASDMERVKFDDGSEFESRFEVYSTAPGEAKALLASAAVRAQLVEARGAGWGSRLFVYLSPTDGFVAITGKDRFEPGSMLRSRPGQERVRSMFDEVCHSLATLKRLKAAFG